jgi:hypothetical protein
MMKKLRVDRNTVCVLSRTDLTRAAGGQPAEPLPTTTWSDYVPNRCIVDPSKAVCLTGDCM